MKPSVPLLAVFPSPLSGEGPPTATNTEPPARGWAVGNFLGVRVFSRTPQNLMNIWNCLEIP